MPPEISHTVSSKSPTDEQFDRFSALFASFGTGCLRLMRFTMVAAVAPDVLRGITSTPAKERGQKHGNHLRAVGAQALDSFTYVSMTSALVYLAALFDSLLSDTLKFLLLAFPSAIGPQQKVEISTILDAKTREDIINQFASKRVRQSSSMSFLDRIAEFETLFGVTPKLDQEAQDSLEHYASIRNTIVHDQSILGVQLGTDGVVEVFQKTCSRHPTPVTLRDFRIAYEAFLAATSALYTATAATVFKVPPSATDDIRRLLDN